MTHYTFLLKHNQTTTKVRVIETATLYELAEILLHSIDFELDHAFGFHSDLSRPHSPNQKKEFTLFSDLGEAYVDHDKGVEKTDVNTVFSEGETLLFHFDYGEDWMFQITCEKIETSNSRKRKPEILEVKGELPQQYPDSEEEWDDPEDGKPTNIIGFNPKTGEKIEIPINSEEEDNDAMVERILKVNSNHIERFASHLRDKGLSDKTINKHCSNIQFYGNDFITYYTHEKVTVDLASFYIGEFLGSFFIRKCLWSNQTAIKEYITSFKKFYGWLHEIDLISEDDYKDLIDVIKSEKSDWLETMKKYDDPDFDLEDIF